MTRTVHLVALLFTMAVTAGAQTRPSAPADLYTPPADATRTDDGLVWYTLAPGTGERRPAGDAFVKIRYAIFNEEARLLEHVPADRASIMALQRMMPGWREVVSVMSPGQKTRLWLPATLSGGKMPAGETYVIDTELVDIIEGPKTPDDLEQPPAGATRSRSGLASQVIRAGNGTARPRPNSIVRVNYSGWTTDGRLFDSTLLRGQPAEFRLSDVIAGWTEGVQLMTEGEMRRFWIPARLAYAKDASKPQGMLIFDIELLDIR